MAGDTITSADDKSITLIKQGKTTHELDIDMKKLAENISSYHHLASTCETLSQKDCQRLLRVLGDNKLISMLKDEALEPRYKAVFIALLVKINFSHLTILRETYPEINPWLEQVKKINALEASGHKNLKLQATLREISHPFQQLAYLLFHEYIASSSWFLYLFSNHHHEALANDLCLMLRENTMKANDCFSQIEKIALQTLYNNNDKVDAQGTFYGIIARLHVEAFFPNLENTLIIKSELNKEVSASPLS
jgi:hypothetical protein